MPNAPDTVLERLEVIRAAMDDFGTLAGGLDPDDLGPVLGELGELGARITVQMVAITAAAETNGVVERSQSASTRAWIAEHSWHARGQATAIAKAAAVLRRPDLAPVADAIVTLDVTPQVAATIAEQFDKTIDHLLPGSDPAVLDLFIAAGSEGGPAGVRHLREHVIAHFSTPGSFQQEQDRHRCQVHLSAGRETADGVHQYDLTLDPESRALLEAAIGPLSAPRPGPDGEPDPRSVGRRRGEALVEGLRPGFGVATSGRPSSAKATIHVTMDVHDLRDRIGAGTVIGTRAQDTLIAPDTVRRLACDAAIIPAVLGSDSQILDLGREVRLFDRHQMRALWLRDRHCTFPGCSAPAAWCRGHHVIHWIDGGPTDLDNGALLCERHHTIVHRDQLAARLTGGTFIWDREHGSYQRLLTEVRRT